MLFSFFFNYLSLFIFKEAGGRFYYYFVTLDIYGLRFLRKHRCYNFLYGIFENEINFFTIQGKQSHVSIQLINVL